MSISVERAWERLQEIDDVLIITHSSPDGDAVGSAFALYLALTKMGKNARVETDEIPAVLLHTEVKEAYRNFTPRFVVTTDVGDKKLLTEETREKYGDKVDLNIDHHGTNVMFAKETFVDSSCAAACEALYDIFTYGGLEIDREIALRLYTGIATDTGCFKYSNTTPKTLRVTASLLETGINVVDVNSNIFDIKTPEYVMFERMAMNNLRLCHGGKTALMVITQEMYQAAGIKEQDTLGINGLPRTIAGVYAGITVKEKKNGIYHASVRTKDPLSASEICALFGGGGHQYAAGCEFGSDVNEAVHALLCAVGEKLREKSLLNL